ncbi:MAG: DUF1573 domain-containing protein [Sphingobacteriales bacterium]|nr:MAG: DUF1573 domain-containing protein [Sphingobacteriales bacterium]
MTASAYAQNKPAPQDAAAEQVDAKAGKFSFKKETHDFGQLAEGPAADYEFEFTNTGKKPIIISNAQASCGCTTPKWTKDPILPGKKGSIKVTYNTANRPGPFNKDVIITSNAQQSPMILHIKGNVKAKAVAEAAPAN